MALLFRKVCTLGISLAFVCLGGCKWIDDALSPLFNEALKREINATVIPLQKELADSHKQLNEQSASLTSLRHDHDELKKRIDSVDTSLKYARNEYKSDSATLTSDGNGYGIARTSLGAAVVTVENMMPYLEGYKIKLWITMLVPIEVTGVKGTLSWVEQDPEVLKKDKNIIRQKEFSSTEKFQSGRYTEVEVVVSPASAASLKLFYVALVIDQISALRPHQAQPK